MNHLTCAIKMAARNILLRPCVMGFQGFRSLSTKPKFGFIFDIDGVLVRGKNVLPPVKEAFKRLRGEDGKFRVPTVFVTNSGNSLRSQKAADISNWIGFEVTESQVVLAHTPLQMFHQFHKKTILITGQGPIKEISKELGFEKTVTLDELVKNFPNLDYVNMLKRNPQSGPIDPNFPTIEGIVLFSEPTNWETPLQLIVDLLITNGAPISSLGKVPYPHIPVLACNMDLLWASQAPISRYGHGAFLVCLEHLYKKVTGKDLVYSALIGKPSEVTYYHADNALYDLAKNLGIGKIDTIYAIGDNINTDVYGANLYDKYLSRYASGKGTTTRALEKLLGKNLKPPHVKACISILVETGVHQKDSDFSPDHAPRDFLPVEEGLCKPAFVVEHVGSGIDLAFAEEKYT